jgi:hypothetical protein
VLSRRLDVRAAPTSWLRKRSEEGLAGLALADRAAATDDLAFVAFFLIVGCLGGSWLFGDPWRFEDILGTGVSYLHMPPFDMSQASDLQLPHIWDIAYALSEPVQRNSETPLLLHLVGAAYSTWSMAVIGFAIGALIGITLASIFVHSALSERAFMPYVIASQAIPIVALAPIISASAGRGNTAVIIIAVYLTFFPVTIAQARGLAPDRRSGADALAGASRWASIGRSAAGVGATSFTALKVRPRRPSWGPSSARAQGREGRPGPRHHQLTSSTSAAEKLWAPSHRLADRHLLLRARPHRRDAAPARTPTRQPRSRHPPGAP